MRWTRRCAQMLLRARCALINGEWADNGCRRIIAGQDGGIEWPLSENASRAAKRRS
jgi:hypothetical protein